ncbi:MAG: hypothetical protein ACK5QT_04830 [Oligoflexia bacterium]|jgi:hypothetical protein
MKLETTNLIEVRSRLESPLLLGAVATILFGVVATAATPTMAVATVAYFSMCSAILLRGNRRLHGKWMGLAMLTDVGLVIFLEATRHATGTAIGGSLNPLQILHVATSLIAVLLYLPLLWMGLRALKGLATPAERRNHRLLGMGAFLFRTAGFLLMFSMLSRNQG